jgi:hypothetical protein
MIILGQRGSVASVEIQTDKGQSIRDLLTMGSVTPQISSNPFRFIKSPNSESLAKTNLRKLNLSSNFIYNINKKTICFFLSINLFENLIKF